MNDIKQNKDRLIIGYLKEELSEEQINELLDWIRTSNSNKRHFDELLEIWLTSSASHDHFSKFDYKKGFLRFKEKIKKSC